MKVVGLDYIDYWQGIYAIRRGLKNRFGIRVREGRCWALVQLGDDEANTFGKPHEIPVEISTLPSVLRMIVGDHQLSYPDSDLIDVLTGKSIREAFGSPDKTGVASDGKRNCASERINVASDKAIYNQPIRSLQHF